MNFLNSGRMASIRRGFALVITLSLMILLTVIAMGLLSLSAVSLRTSSQRQAEAEARANARLALMMAIGERQKEVGPDSRISVPYDAGTSPPPSGQPRWTAVYDAWQRPTAANTPESPNSRAPKFRGWLASGANQASGGPSSFPDTNKPPLLVDTEGLGENANLEQQKGQIRAPMYAVTRGNQQGRIGWWTSDESVKVKINAGLLPPNAFPARPYPFHEPSISNMVVSTTTAQNTDLTMQNSQLVTIAESMDYEFGNDRTMPAGAGGRNLYHGAVREVGSGGSLNVVKRRIPLAPPLSLGAFENAIACGLVQRFASPGNALNGDANGLPAIAKAIGNSWSNPFLTSDSVISGTYHDPSWKALLSSVKEQEMIVNGGAKQNFGHPLGTLGYAQDSSPTNDWIGLRDLSVTEIDQLAKAIVVEVKAHGPFLSMADFVNRRPNIADATQKSLGALQAAIDKSGLNACFTGCDRSVTAILSPEICMPRQPGPQMRKRRV